MINFLGKYIYLQNYKERFSFLKINKVCIAVKTVTSLIIFVDFLCWVSTWRNNHI